MDAVIPTSVYSVMEATASKACDYAYDNAMGEFKSLKGGRYCFFPVVEETDEGIDIGVGINPQYHYLIYLENGFESFTMKSAYGKTIPMLVNGNIVYRKCTGLNQFRSGSKNYWQRDANGNLYETYAQARAWVHPGHEPVKFIDEALDAAIEEDAEKIDFAAAEYEMGDEWQTFLNILTAWS